MDLPAVQFPFASSARESSMLRAVQSDSAVTCVDWQAFHAWQADDPLFTGVVSVQDGNGRQLSLAAWTSPTDRAAEQSLERIGWHRIGPWAADEAGRRAAPVARDFTRKPAHRDFGHSTAAA